MQISNIVNVKDVAVAKGENVKGIGPTATIRDAAKILAENKISLLIARDEIEEMIGVLSERDVVRVIGIGGDGGLNSTVDSAMTADVKTCKTSNHPVDVMEMMVAGGFRHMPVVDDGKFIGLLSNRDVSSYTTKFSSPKEQADLWTKISWL